MNLKEFRNAVVCRGPYWSYPQPGGTRVFVHFMPGPPGVYKYAYDDGVTQIYCDTLLGLEEKLHTHLWQRARSS